MSEASALASVLEAMIERMVERRVAAALEARGPAAPAPGRWMTPPRASRETGVPVKTIRAWAASGVVAKRSLSARHDARGLKYKVNADQVAAVAEGGPAVDEDVAELARAIRAERS